MRRAWLAWVELLDRREPATSLALARILMASAVLGDLVWVRAYDLVAAVWAPPPFGLGYAAIWDRNPPWSIRWLGASVETAELLWAATAIAAFLLLIGAATRVSALVLALLLAQLNHIAPDGDRGVDVLLRTAIAILPFSLSHARWSVDAWLWRRLRRPLPERIPGWPRLLLFAQLVWMYFSAGHNKGDPAWGPLGGFSALAVTLSDPHFARFDPGWIATCYPLLQLGALGTVTFEWAAPLLPLATWWQRTPERPGRLRRWSNRLRLRWVWIATGVVFHLGIAVTMRLGVFPWGVLALYPVLFHPDEIDAAIGRITAAARARWRPGAAGPEGLRYDGPMSMTRTDSGLSYEDTRVGDGASPAPGQRCVMHYTGWLWNDGARGAKFDSSVDRGQPFVFPLGVGKVIKGWDEGVASMKVGGKRTLLIPPDLGYGAGGAGAVIPPGATLLFEVELLDVK